MFDFNLRNRNDGFSFIEVLVALVVAVYGFVFIFRAFFTTLDALDHVQKRLYLSNSFHNKLTQIKAKILLEKEENIERIKDSRLEDILGDTYFYSVDIDQYNKNSSLYKIDLRFVKDSPRRLRVSRELLFYKDEK